jgi:hypothetical protein
LIVLSVTEQNCKYFLQYSYKWEGIANTLVNFEACDYIFILAFTDCWKLVGVDLEFYISLLLEMPVSTIILLSLETSIPKFISTLHKTTLKPLVIAKVARWIITPSTLSKVALLQPSQPWDILLILPGASNQLPENLRGIIKDQWSIQAGIPSRLLASFNSTNEHLLQPSAGEIPKLTGALSHPRIAKSSQALELSDELRQWISSGQSPKGAVSMLNLLAFQAGRKDEYLKYGKAFAESIGSRRGGVAKIVGKVVPGGCSDGCQEWEEVCNCGYRAL